MSGGSSEGDVEALRIAREEARTTLDAQLSTLDDIDSKALSVFRLNVAVVGVVLSALSFAAGTDAADVSLALNPTVGAGVALFVLSAAAAGLTYTTAGQRVGADPSGLVDARGRSERAYLSWLVESYADWIRHNQRTNLRKALLVTLSILGTVAGTLVLGVGLVAAYTGDVVGPSVAAVLTLAVLAEFADLRGQIRRLVGGLEEVPGSTAIESLETVMAGQQAFHGRDGDEE